MRPIALGLVAATALAAVVFAARPAAAEVSVSLKGSPESMARQNEVARRLGLRFVSSSGEMRSLVNQGMLVFLRGNAHYTFPSARGSYVARPEVGMFIERLAADYHAATGEKLVVTSLTRLSTRQPRNAHPLSVHPAGIAVDLRVSSRAASRAWLERTLLAMEQQGLLDVTREHRPPHYHVAIFPEPYLAHVAQLTEQAPAQLAPPSDDALAHARALLEAPLGATAPVSALPVDLAAPDGQPGGLSWLMFMLPLAMVPPAMLRLRGIRLRKLPAWLRR